jgi:hypothetical protein
MSSASRRVVCVAVALIALAGCTGYRLVRDGTVQASAAERVKARLVAIRGLAFREPVPVTAISAEEARAYLARDLESQFPPGDLARLGRVYGALGLVPPGTDLERAFVELYATQLAGFYDPIDRRMLLVTNALVATGFFTRVLEGIIRRDLAGEMVLAHELTHALQDQHYGLSTGRADLGDDDAQLALRAVYEGDATLAGYAAVLDGMKPATAVRLARSLEAVPAQMARAYPDVPALIRDSVVFEYVAGVDFVAQAYRVAGWNGVNALLARPPRSTEQVLHPEKYFVKPESPLRVQLGALAPYVRGEWQMTEEATLGELTIRILGETYLDRDAAAVMAAGWDGDRMMGLARDDEIALVWLTAWDSERDAQEFFTAYAGILARRHPGASAATENAVALGGAEPFTLERRGDKVLAIEGPLDDDLPALAERIWRRSSFEPDVPWVPIDVARR